MKFQIGQKVVLARDIAFKARPDINKHPIVGHIYTIREFHVRSVDNIGIRLCEIVNPIAYYWGGRAHTIIAQHEDSFPIDCFEPVVDRKTDISVFTALLNKPLIPAEKP